MNNTGFHLLVVDLDDKGLALLSIPSESHADFIMKVIASTDWDQGAMLHVGELPELCDEARPFAGGMA